MGNSSCGPIHAERASQEQCTSVTRMALLGAWTNTGGCPMKAIPTTKPSTTQNGIFPADEGVLGEKARATSTRIDADLAAPNWSSVSAPS